MKKIWFIIILLLSLILKHDKPSFICSTQFQINIIISDKFSTDEKEIIKNSFLEWQTYTKSIVLFNINYFDSKYKSLYFERVSDDDLFAVEIDNYANGNVLGAYEEGINYSVIFIIPDRLTDFKSFKSTTLHEIGHSIGLNHNKIKNTLMYPNEDFASINITKYDLTQFCKIYSCN